MQIILLEVDPILGSPTQRRHDGRARAVRARLVETRIWLQRSATQLSAATRSYLAIVSCEPSAGDTTPRPWKAAEDPRFAMAVYRVTLAHGTVDPIEDGWD